MNREILRLALPALGSLAADPLVSLVDTAFVGRIGDTALAALAVNAAIFGVVFFLFNFLAYGTTPLVAGAEAAGEPAEAKRVISAAAILAGLLGLSAFIVLQTGGPWLLDVMQTPEAAQADALAYLRIRAFAAPAVLLMLVGHGAFRGRQDTATPLRITLAFNLVNLVLDPILIFVVGWGLAGAAVATTIAQWIGAGWFGALLWRDWAGVSEARTLLPRMLRVGRDLTLRTMALLGALTFATAVAARAGVAIVAGHQVVSQLWLLTALILDALAVAAQALVGRLVGQGDNKQLTALTYRLAGWSVLVGFVIAALFAALLPVVPAWFGATGATAAEIRSALPLLVALQPIGALVFIGDGLYIGASRFRLLTVSTVVAGAATIGYYLVVEPQSLSTVWWGIGVLLLVRLAFFVVDFARHRTVAPSPTVAYTTK